MTPMITGLTVATAVIGIIVIFLVVRVAQIHMAATEAFDAVVETFTEVEDQTNAAFSKLTDNVNHTIVDETNKNLITLNQRLTALEERVDVLSELDDDSEATTAELVDKVETLELVADVLMAVYAERQQKPRRKKRTARKPKKEAS